MAGRPLNDVLETALGRAHRRDPVRGQTGGPAGNARLTAWLGLILLGLFIAECVTLLDLHGLITWHIVLGTILVPLVVAKTAVTGWRVVRYYTGSEDYRQAGPPPLLLRLLGPLVVLSGLAVLGTGLALIALRGSTFTPLVTIAGQQVDALTLHKISFVVWLAVVGLHTLIRLVPAARLAVGDTTRTVPGLGSRAVAVILAVALGAGAGLVVLHYSGYWSDEQHFHHGDHLKGGDG